VCVRIYICVCVCVCMYVCVCVSSARGAQSLALGRNILLGTRSSQLNRGQDDESADDFEIVED
jgi:hypothetical protein